MLNLYPVPSILYLATMAALKFQLQHTDSASKARAGKITTGHGEILTPVFMPVGTAGSVKAVTQQQLMDEVKAQIILGNTYHLYLRPGLEVLEKAGGLHRFNGWNRPILTDSGGYQVFSLSGTRKIKEEGVTFQSHIDGSSHLFTPENVIDIQRIIGGDIMMAFDECPPGGCEFNYAKESLELTNRWLDRCFNRFNETKDKYGFTQNLFPIVQGGTYKDLRKQSCEYVATKEATGNAIGGLSVGEHESVMYEICEWCCDHLPKEKP
ncbi:MAG TPA: tRNA guanosine(34) transglycosylase Tgt, partial [Chitinophagaceae bacterium]|nr:tRNA guanosine(34) transglycosylase Tgt [Chitinophagaceae bacterium]